MFFAFLHFTFSAFCFDLRAKDLFSLFLRAAVTWGVNRGASWGKLCAKLFRYFLSPPSSQVVRLVRWNYRDLIELLTSIHATWKERRKVYFVFEEKFSRRKSLEEEMKCFSQTTKKTLDSYLVAVVKCLVKDIFLQSQSKLLKNNASIC